MSHVVCQPCVKCNNKNCLVVCPVAALRQDKEMVVIDPEICIDCGACVPECARQAIYIDNEVPDKWKSFIQLNREKSKNLL